MSISRWMLERNRDTADLLFGKSAGPPQSAAQTRSDECKAAGLTPFIVAAAATAAFGGKAGLDNKQRLAAGSIAALLFLAI